MVQRCLFDGIRTHGLPKHDVAFPDPVDDPLDCSLAEELLGVTYCGDLQGVQLLVVFRD
jgi:hypothetical protein